MKKLINALIVVVLVIACLFTFCGCGEPTATPEATPSDEPVNETPQPSAELTEMPEPTPTPAPKPLEIPEVTLETRIPDPIVQPEPGENGLVRIDSIVNFNTCRSVEKWVDLHKPQRLFYSDDYMFLFDCKPISVVFAATVPIKVSDYSFVTDMTDDPEGNNRPTSWKVYGANKVSFADEVLLDTRSGEQLPNEHRTESQIYEIADPDYYNFYKIVFEESAGQNTNFQLFELHLFGKDGDCVGDYVKYNSSLDGYTIVNGAINMKMLLAIPFPQAENPLTNLYDCDIETRSWVNLQHAQDYDYVDFFFGFKQGVHLDAYRFTISDPWGCPVKWELYGTDNKNLVPEDMYLIDSRDYVDMPSYKYAETDVFEIRNPGEYRYYVLRVLDDEFGNDENWLSPEWLELTLLMTNENANKASGK